MDGYRVEQRHRASRRDASPVLAGALVALLAMVPGIATAQHDAADAAMHTADSDRPSSTETGQTPLDESFTRSRDEWVRETRRKAWKDTEFDAQIRSYSLDRDKYDGSESEAWALGGSLGFKTGYFRDRFALGATGYTSQRLHGPEDKDGLYDGGDGQVEWRAGVGYIDEIKERNSDDFVSMATVAGAPEGVERGVYVAGANYRNGDLSIGQSTITATTSSISSTRS
jgi:hypothetical protein